MISPLTYQVRIIGGGGTNQNLNTLIYDFSGSSYHYNSDYSTSGRIINVIDPSTCTTVPIAQWQFNNNTTPTPAGSGTFSNPAAITYSFPPPSRDYLDTTGWVTNSTPDSSHYLQFSVPTTGYYNIRFQYNTRRSNNGSPIYTNVGYSSDNGATYTESSSNLLSNNWITLPVDLSSVSSLNNNSNTVFRLQAYGDGGNTLRNVHFDTVTVSGCVLPSTLNLGKVANPTTYTSFGETITYTFTLTNTGATILNSPTVTDPMFSGRSIRLWYRSP